MPTGANRHFAPVAVSFRVFLGSARWAKGGPALRIIAKPFTLDMAGTGSPWRAIRLKDSGEERELVDIYQAPRHHMPRLWLL